MSRFEHSGPARPTTVAAALAAAPARTRSPDQVTPTAPGAGPVRAGVICNPRSHQNLRAEIAHQVPVPDVLLAAPRTHGELAATLAEFAARGIDLLVIDGGDGTVRDVLTAAAEAFGAALPQVAILPNGKTNALALDLGVPADWTLDDALAAARTGGLRRRAPLVIGRDRASAPPLHGFLFGAGGFVRATALAQRTHAIGAFHGVAVALATVWALLQVVFGRAGGEWRRGDPMRIESVDEVLIDGQGFFVLGSTLETLPAGVRPLGPAQPGFKLLTVAAPPRFVLPAAVAVIAGRTGGWLERCGYRHRRLDGVEATIGGGFILDGDFYDDGHVTVREGAPIAFVVP